MSLLERLKMRWSVDYERCDKCKIALGCLCYRCDNMECRASRVCKKEKAITYCQCQNCDRENCKVCKPDIH